MDRKAIKARGKAAFKANYWKTVLVALFLMVIVGGLGGGSTTTVSYNPNGAETPSSSNVQDILPESVLQDPLNENGTQSIDQLPEQIADLTSTDELTDEDATLGGLLKEASEEIEISPGAAAGYGLLGTLLSIFFFAPLEVGCKSFMRKNVLAPQELDELKTGFVPKYWRNVGGMLLRRVFVFLWALLLIIPGIIMSYAYDMTSYIMAEDDDISAMDAIRKSKEMMKGHKWELFVMDLSFIGWYILSVLTLGILYIFYVQPYYYSSHASFYENLKAQQVPTAPVTDVPAEA